MLLRNPFMVENIYQDQPYISLLLVSPFCANSCIGCHNQELKNKELKDYSLLDLTMYYLKHNLVEGITVAGLEPYHSGDEWWSELQKFILTADIKKVTIYTSYNYIKSLECDELYYKLGSYNNNLKPKEVIIGDWSITLGSSNQDFIKVR